MAKKSNVAITYGYLLEMGEERMATWRGERQDALAAAVDFLCAAQSAADPDEYIYRAEETGSDWAVSEDDMLILGAAVLDGREADAYSLWCAVCPGRKIG